MYATGSWWRSSGCCVFRQRNALFSIIFLPWVSKRKQDFTRNLHFFKAERSRTSKLGEAKQWGACLRWEWSDLTMNGWGGQLTRDNTSSCVWLLFTKQVLKSHFQAPSTKHSTLHRPPPTKLMPSGEERTIFFWHSGREQRLHFPV